jgi:hypothetical protein
VRDINGTIISQKTINQMPGSLRWMNLATDETAGRVGTFEVGVVNANRKRGNHFGDEQSSSTCEISREPRRK